MGQKTRNKTKNVMNNWSFIERSNNRAGHFVIRLTRVGLDKSAHRICLTYLLDIRAGDAFSVVSVWLDVPQHSTLTLKLIKVTVITCTLKIEFLKHNKSNKHVHKTGQKFPETVCESLPFSCSS